MISSDCACTSGTLVIASNTRLIDTISQALNLMVVCPCNGVAVLFMHRIVTPIDSVFEVPCKCR